MMYIKMKHSLYQEIPTLSKGVENNEEKTNIISRYMYVVGVNHTVFY